MRIDISTLSAELVDPAIGETRITLRFGDARIIEWPVPEEGRARLTGYGGYGHPDDDTVREYVETFVARKLEALFQPTGNGG